MKTPLCLFASLTLAVGASAQLGKPLPIANNNGSHKIDAQAIISAATSNTYNGCLGVAYDWHQATYYVSARRSPTTPTTNPHMLFGIVWDATTKAWKVTSYPVPGLSTSSWGLRDLAFDGKFLIYGSAENSATGFKVLAFNTASKKFDSNFDVTVPSTSPATTTRALAFNTHTQTFWAGNFSSNHVEFDKTGKQLKSVPNMQASSYGAGYDSVRKTVWWFGQGGASVATTRVVGREMDPKTGLATGNVFIGDTGIPHASYPGGVAGGCEFYVRKDGTPVLLLMAQATSDTIYEIYGCFNYGTPSNGDLTMNNQDPTLGNAAFGFTVSKSTAGAVALILGSQKTAVPLNGPQFAANTSIYTLPLNIMGSAIVANGSATLPFPLPNVAAFKGLATFWQAVGLHTSGPFDLSTTGGGETLLY